MRLSDEELRDAVQRIITPPPSPFPHANQKWRHPPADLAALAPLYVDHRGTVVDCLFGQVEAGNLFAPKPGTLALHDAANDWNPFFGFASDSSPAQRKRRATRIEASLLQPLQPYELRPVGRNKNARKIMAQRSLKLPADQRALTALIQCCELWDTTGEKAAFAPFLLRHGFTDPDCYEIFDDVLDHCAVAADRREDFFAAHARNSDDAFGKFVAMKLHRSRGRRSLVYRGLPAAERDALEARQRELIEIERRRALKVTPLPNPHLGGESLSSA